MRNRTPIFLHGFQRGGTNILQNLLASHPAIGLADAETHQIFSGQHAGPRAKWFYRLSYLPILLGARQHVFSPRRLNDDYSVPRLLWPYVDFLLYQSKRRGRANETQTGNGSAPARPPLAELRLLVKGVNGAAFLTGLFAAMYPDATFIALVRNGLALCEGFMRRGWAAEDFGALYEAVCQKMLHDAARYPNYHLICFEDLVADPIGQTQKLYAALGLDIGAVARFRVQAKASMDKDGVRRYTLAGKQDREVSWVELAQLAQVFRADVNQNQIKRLDAQAQHAFLNQARRSMQQLGYLGSEVS